MLLLNLQVHHRSPKIYLPKPPGRFPACIWHTQRTIDRLSDWKEYDSPDKFLLIINQKEFHLTYNQKEIVNTIQNNMSIISKSFRFGKKRKSRSLVRPNSTWHFCPEKNDTFILVSAVLVTWNISTRVFDKNNSRLFPN